MCTEYLSTFLVCCHDLNDFFKKLAAFISPYFLFSLRPDSSKYSKKAPKIAIDFLSFKETILVYLLKILVTHSKTPIICLIYLMIAYQLNLHPKYCLYKVGLVFCFSNILIRGLCNFLVD